MRAGTAAAVCAACALLGGALAACVDLFHGTSDILTACEVDASIAGCTDAGATGEAATGAGTDFCGWSDSLAQQNAAYACAWLGACETPMGRNAFGPCMFEALLAYDCAANPSHPATGTAHDLWDCLWRVQSCADVDACVFPSKPQPCGTNGTACGTAGSAARNNFDVRVECVDGGRTRGENCAMWGQTCASAGQGGYCAGAAGNAGLACDVDECSGSSIHWCVDGGDIGIDCASNGAGTCGGFPSPTDAGWVACLPRGDAAACSSAASAQCDGGVATSCAAGVVETIDCNALLQSEHGCTPGAFALPFDWTSPCVVDDPDAAPCVEGCAGTQLTGCARGATYVVDCASPRIGLGACTMVTTDDGRATHAACSPP
jgi:hypothetical protein